MMTGAQGGDSCRRARGGARLRGADGLNRVGSMMNRLLRRGPDRRRGHIVKASRDKYATFFHAMLGRGVAFAPSYCEAAFVSTAHSDEDIQTTLSAATALPKWSAG